MLDQISNHGKPTTLAGTIAEGALRLLGAEEHVQIAGLIQEAKTYVVDRDAALAVSQVLSDHTWSVESNLDLVKAPGTTTWFEWPLPTHSGRGGGDDARTGCLVTPHPENQDLMMVVTAWETGGAAEHSYGVAAMYMPDIALNAKLARRSRERTKEQSVTRLMGHIHAFVPASFRDEISIIADPGEQSMDAVLRDATSEIPFLLALMLAMNSENGVISNEDETGLRRIHLPKSVKMKSLTAMMHRFRATDGFVRTGFRRTWWNRHVRDEP